MNKIFLALLLVLALGCQQNPEPAGSFSIPIEGNWQFKNVKDSAWLPAVVPGEVHRDLLRNKVIPDPFVGNNELDLQWISEESWEYRTDFKVDEEMLAMSHLELEFRGLDTYASVFLNGTLILEGENAFRTYHVSAKPTLQGSPILKKENELRVVFRSPGEFETKAKANLPYELPGGDRVFTRKPQFHYGWDWGPKFITCGIGQRVVLHGWNDFKMDDVFVRQVSLGDSKAELEAVFDFRSRLSDSIEIDVFVNGELNTTGKASLLEHLIKVPFSISTPQKWWPHNLGEPYRYDLEFVLKQGKTVLDSVRMQKGLRTVELVNEKDAIGESFYFKVNGEPVYAKGANYIPQHSFQSAVTDTHYEQLLEDAVDANMNMLRVWGGGRYEDDIFYDLCDEKGILVWQDFMFACAMYPGDIGFLENVEQEAIDNIKRLRNHCSIALWCGNNENAEGWARWGWQADRSEAEKDEIWRGYSEVFTSLLPGTLRRFHPEAPYWESSPQYGRGNPLYETVGDAHDWWVWHDAYPFEHFQDAVPRFMSEFGFQSFPGYKAVRYINGNDSLDISSKAFETHQKHPRGDSLIELYMARDYPVPTAAEDYVYVSQLLQARGITMGIEAQRRSRPHNMGTLYWQLNDCWPVVSWSGIDYFGQWKALHYQAKKSFEDVLVSMSLKEGKLKTHVVNDLLEEQSGILTIEGLSFGGRSLFKFEEDIVVPANSSLLGNERDIALATHSRKTAVVVARFNGQRALLYLVPPKDLVLKKEEVQQKIVRNDKGFSIELQSTVLQKDVFLFTEAEGFFSDNFFDLLPGEKRTIEFETEVGSLEKVQIKTLNQLVNL